MSVPSAKPQISLGIRPVWSESSQCAQWVGKDPSFLHADSEDSDQTGRMPRLIWVFAGRTVTLLVLSCRGSYNCKIKTMLVFWRHLAVIIWFNTPLKVIFENKDFEFFPLFGGFFLYTVNFLNIRTPKTYVVITLKFDQCGFSIE